MKCKTYFHMIVYMNSKILFSGFYGRNNKNSINLSSAEFVSLRRLNVLSEGKLLSKLFYLPSEKGSTLKGKNLLPVGANSFLLK